MVVAVIEGTSQRRLSDWIIVSENLMIFKSSVALLELKCFDSLLYMHMRGVMQCYIFQVVKNTANQNARNLFNIACV